MKRILSLIIAGLFVINILPVVYASESGSVECSGISFVDTNGEKITSDYSSGKIIAKAEVKNNTSKGIKPVMLVCLYESGILENLWYDDATQITTGQTGTVKTEFTPPALSNLHTIKATVVDNLIDINSYYETATLFDNSVNLSGILIDGKAIDGYSDNIDFYTFKTSTNNIKINPLLKDGGTVVTTVMPESVPGVAKINIESPLGTLRTVNVALFENEEQLYSLQGIKYTVGNNTYEIKDFDPSVTEYTVTLPDNTFYVKAEPVSVYEDGKTVLSKTYIKDINHKDNIYGNGVVYLSGNVENDYKNTFVERLSSDGLIPIKNEQTNAIIKISYGENEKTYTVEFKAKQPRLTSFNIVGGKDESHKPAFVGGAALNNDNGTTTGTDRAWSYTNISENLIGASMFMFDTKSASTAGNWYLDNSEGEHYNFTADTDGRIYHISQYEITNEEFINNGWEKIENKGVPQITEKDWVNYPRDYNDFESLFYMNHCTWNASERFLENSNTLTSGLSIYTMAHVYKKDFKAGEKVSVYNIGNKDTYYFGRRTMNTSVIKWKLDGVTFPEDNISEDDNQNSGNESGGNESGGNESGGNESGGNESGGNESGGNESVLPSLSNWILENKLTDYVNIFTACEFLTIESEGGEE